MIERSITTAGCVTYWSLPATADLQSVRTAFEDAGLPHLAPSAPSESIALREALSVLYGHNNVLIRPLKGGGGYNVVLEERLHSDDKNQYSVTISAKLGPSGLIVGDPYQQQTERISAEMDRQRTRASRSAMATALAATIPALSGVTLRETGGIYYLPPHAEPSWERLALALEGRAPGTCIYRLRTAHGEQELRAIRDAAIADLTAEAERIKDECCEGMATMRESTAISRRGQIADLRDRLTVYRDLLGEGLQQIARAIDEADATAGAVQLAATARLARERKATK